MPHTDQTILEAEVFSFREVHHLPGDWSPGTLRSLLADLEIDTEGTAESDLLDLVLMSLGDLEPDQAGAAVLRAVFGEGLSAGQRINLAADLENDRPWENFADLSRQAGIFTTAVLLQQAFPKLFGKPDATRVEIAFRAPTEAEAALLLRASAAVVLRALGPGLGPRSIVTRLYGEGLRSGPFPEAEHILWRLALTPDTADPRRVVAEIFGAQSFLGTLDEAAPWQAGVNLRPGAG